MTAEVTHRVQCAAITNGCRSTLSWTDHVSTADVDEDLLRVNGWRLDHGLWVCGLHPAPEDPA